MSIKPFTAVGITNTLMTVRKKEDVYRNLDIIKEMLEGIHYMRIDYPIRLVAIAEGAIQTFVDSQLGWDHKTNALEGPMSTTVPGPETDYLADLAKKHETYICAQLRAKDPELGFEDRYFNMLFVIDPQGKLIHKYHKLQTFAPEPSVVPHDVWDRFIEVYGTTLNSFYPVVETEIGKIGTLECMDTSFPEIARGLAMNGAEIIYAPSYAEPYVGRGWHEIQIRARALDNNCYVISPNSGDWFLYPNSPVPTQVHGGYSMIVDYTGQVLASHVGDGQTFVSAPIDIEALRYWRTHVSFGSWLKDLRTEQFELIYKQPIIPKNSFMDKTPGPREERLELERNSVGELIKRGVYTPAGRWADEND
jgi:predicted amidohydrolase